MKNNPNQGIKKPDLTIDMSIFNNKNPDKQLEIRTSRSTRSNSNLIKYSEFIEQFEKSKQRSIVSKEWYNSARLPLVENDKEESVEPLKLSSARSRLGSVKGSNKSFEGRSSAFQFDLTSLSKKESTAENVFRDQKNNHNNNLASPRIKEFFIQADFATQTDEEIKQCKKVIKLKLPRPQSKKLEEVLKPKESMLSGEFKEYELGLEKWDSKAVRKDILETPEEKLFKSLDKEESSANAFLNESMQKRFEDLSITPKKEDNKEVLEPFPTFKKQETQKEKNEESKPKTTITYTVIYPVKLQKNKEESIDGRR